MTTNKGGGGDDDTGTDAGTHDATTFDDATIQGTVDADADTNPTGATVEDATDNEEEDLVTIPEEEQEEFFYAQFGIDVTKPTGGQTIGATHETVGQRTARLAKRQAIRDQMFPPRRASTPNTAQSGLTDEGLDDSTTGSSFRKFAPVQPKTKTHANSDFNQPFTPRAANVSSQAQQAGSRPARGQPSPSLNHREHSQSKAQVLKLFSSAKATSKVPLTGRDFQVRSVTREQKLKQSEKVRLEFRKLSCYHTPTLLAYIHPSTVCKANTEQTATLANFDRFLAQQRAHATKFGFNYLYSISLARENEETGRVELYEPEVSLNLLDTSDYPHITTENVKLYLKYLVYDAPYASEEEYNLVLEELEDSYVAMTKSFDKDLFLVVESEMVADTAYYQDFTRAGPMALAVAFKHITLQSAHSGRTIVEQIVALDLKKFEGENVIDYTNHCRTLLNRITNAKDRADEFYDIIYNALLKCSVQDFTFDLRSWHAARRYMSVDNIFDHNALLKQALQTYQELNSHGRWLPTKKSVNLAQKGNKQKKKEEKSDTKPAPKTTEDKLADERKRNKWPAWRREPPKSGESHTRESNKGNKIHWCEKCTFWGNHLTKDHKSKETLAAEKAAKNKESDKKPAAKSTSFSDGTAPDS
jgi:hypothetical protein